jgi:hypothetical protein
MTTKKIEKLQARYDALKVRLEAIGPIMVGTITKRMDRRRSDTAPGGYVVRGPYYQWTWKEKGKTRTRNLTPQQARVYGQAIKNHRKLMKIVLRMRDVSLKILQEDTSKLKKR